MVSLHLVLSCFFFRATATTEIDTLSLLDALPIYRAGSLLRAGPRPGLGRRPVLDGGGQGGPRRARRLDPDRKSTRLNPVTVRPRMPSSAWKKQKVSTRNLPVLCAAATLAQARDAH